MDASIRSVHAASRTLTHAIQNAKPNKFAGFLTGLTPASSSTSSTPTKPRPEIPDPAICADLSPVRQTDIPSIAQCAVHLKFLECLFVLKQKVLKSEEIDKVFDIKPNYKIVKRKGEETKLKDGTMWERRQVKWDKFVELAVVRFIVWWEKLREIVVVEGWEEKERVEMGEDELPPLDVLMVWHSFLLNPKFFRQSCLNKLLFKIDFPWAAINARINTTAWTYTLSSSATETFSTKVTPAPDLFSHLSSWSRNAPKSLKTFHAMTAFPPAQPPTDIPIPVVFHSALLLYRRASLISSLAVSLSAAVQRQCSFVTKMDSRFWIGSPALLGTLKRARSRYSRFLQLYKWYPNTMFVPTLDIDLVWHTHQCSPGAYFIATRENAGKFLNHDDSIAEDKLGVGYERTRENWRVRFVEEYAVCGCWDCEAVIEAMEGMEDRDEGTEEEKRLEESISRAAEEVKLYRQAEAERRRQLEALEKQAEKANAGG